MRQWSWVAVVVAWSTSGCAFATAVTGTTPSPRRCSLGPVMVDVAGATAAAAMVGGGINEVSYEQRTYVGPRLVGLAGIPLGIAFLSSAIYGFRRADGCATDGAPRRARAYVAAGVTASTDTKPNFAGHVEASDRGHNDYGATADAGVRLGNLPLWGRITINHGATSADYAADPSSPEDADFTAVRGGLEVRACEARGCLFLGADAGVQVLVPERSATRTTPIFGQRLGLELGDDAYQVRATVEVQEHDRGSLEFMRDELRRVVSVGVALEGVVRFEL